MKIKKINWWKHIKDITFVYLFIGGCFVLGNTVMQFPPSSPRLNYVLNNPKEAVSIFFNLYNLAYIFAASGIFLLIGFTKLTIYLFTETFKKNRFFIMLERSTKKYKNAASEYKNKYVILKYTYFYFRWIASIPILYFMTISNVTWLSAPISFFYTGSDFFNPNIYPNFYSSFISGITSIPKSIVGGFWIAAILFVPYFVCIFILLAGKTLFKFLKKLLAKGK